MKLKHKNQILSMCQQQKQRLKQQLQVSVRNHDNKHYKKEMNGLQMARMHWSINPILYCKQSLYDNVIHTRIDIDKFIFSSTFMFHNGFIILFIVKFLEKVSHAVS